MRTTTRQVWFLVLPRISMTSVAGPWEVLGHANDLLGREAYGLHLFGPGGAVARTRFGLCLAGVRPLPTRCARPPDTVVVAGASPADPIPQDHAPLVPWLRRHRRRIRRVVSVCTGAFALAAAGLLDGRRATTHWMHLHALRARFPAVAVVDEGIYVEDRGVWTSAGLTAGIDLALALVEEDHGHALAMRVAKRMVLFLRRSGHQAQFGSPPRLQGQEPPRLRELAAFVLEHLAERLPVERLAGAVDMSPRTLSRWCREHLDESPAGLVRRLRLAEARRLLEETDLPLKAVATRAGLGDQSTLWRAFMHDLGVSPAEYRQRFAAQPA
jgi:transcriptional regulator GlxA family with amidase domain